MKKSEKLYLVHIVEAFNRLHHYLPATIEEYTKNEMMQDAVIKVLGNITESATKLEEMSKAQYPDIAWDMIRGMRNILVHEYLGDLKQADVWKTIQEDLPDLVKVARKILKEKYGTEF